MVTAKLLLKAGTPYEFVETRGQSALAQVTGQILRGDYSSFYLAMLNEVDPTSIEAITINFVKQ